MKTIALLLSLVIATPTTTATVASRVPSSLQECKQELGRTIIGYESVIERLKNRHAGERRELEIRLDERERMLRIRTPTVAAELVPPPDPLPTDGHEGASDLWVGIAIGGGGTLVLVAAAVVAAALGGAFR